MRALLLVALAAGCGEVLVDPCKETGLCECKVDVDCTEAHTACNDQVSARTCDCVAGYARGPDGACAFDRLVEDPGFEAQGVWDPGLGAIDVNLNEVTMADPGAARIAGGEPMCGMARITQSVLMPTRSRSEPLVAQLRYRARGPSWAPLTEPAFALGARWKTGLVGQGEFFTVRTCLGTGQYAPESTAGLGAPVDLELMPTAIPFGAGCDDPALVLEIDRFELVPANPGECPPAGEVQNGDLEGEGGWVFEAYAANNMPVSAGVVDGIGQAGSRGIRLYAQNRCSSVAAVNRISMPSSEQVPSPALTFFNRTSAVVPSGIATMPRLGNVVLPEIPAAGVEREHRVCVPAAARGGVVDFVAQLRLDGTCADVVQAESIVDSLAVVNDPSCGSQEALTDPGFESTTTELIGASSTPGRSLARTIADPTNAHGGTRVLQLGASFRCETPTWTANVVIPRSDLEGGPALRFFYKLAPSTDFRFEAFFTTNLLAPVFTAVADGAYHEGLVCLPPRLATRNQTVQFALGSLGGLCAEALPTEYAYLDDLSVGTDPACPR